MAKGKSDDDCMLNFAKYSLFFFNFLFWLTGIIFIIIGIWAYFEKHAFDHGGKTKEDFSLIDIAFDVTILTICLGSAIFIISFSGCIGALRENICLLKFFAYSMGIIFLAQLILAVLAFVFSHEVKVRITTVLEKQAIQRYRDDLDLEDLINWLQETFACCGFGEHGYRDWSLNAYFNCSDNNPSYEKCSVPYSCCITPNDVQSNYINTMCGYHVQDLGIEAASEKVFTRGCIETVMNKAKNNLYVIGGCAIGLAVPQLMGILFARMLAEKIESQNGRTLAYL